MREGGIGSSTDEGESLAPADSIIYKTLSAWNIKFSPSTGKYYVDTTDYHPGELEIEPGDLEKMIEFAKLNMKK